MPQLPLWPQQQRPLQLLPGHPAWFRQLNWQLVADSEPQQPAQDDGAAAGEEDVEPAASNGDAVGVPAAGAEAAADGADADEDEQENAAPAGAESAATGCGHAAAAAAAAAAGASPVAHGSQSCRWPLGPLAVCLARRVKREPGLSPPSSVQVEVIADGRLTRGRLALSL